MFTLPLDPTDDRANPAFKDASSCVQWLGQLQLTNLHQAHGVMRMQLGEFNRYPMRGLERFHSLELLRETVSFIQADYAKKLIAKKLPLNDDELAIFVALISLWQNMVTGYQCCLQACAAGDEQLSLYGALLCQRCLLYSGLQIFEYMRTGYEFDGKLWRQMHELYAFCEEKGWQLEEIDDDINGDRHTTSCNATYTKILLACHAHRADLSRHLLQLLERWLTLWSPTIAVERRYTASKGDASPLAVDLGSSSGLQLPQLTTHSDRFRYLPMVPLSKLIRVKTILLQQGHSPQQLELGEGCNNAECVTFLNYLHQCWCEGHDERADERHSGTQQAKVCYGLEGCYAYIANKPFKQPARDESIDTLSRKQIAAFGRVLSENNRHDPAAINPVLETWQSEDESIRGTRLLRVERAGMRLGFGQLMAVRPTNADTFMAGTVSWVKVTRSGQLHAGVRYLPGLPQAIAMKATGVNLTVSNKYVEALLLPAVLSLKTSASLLAPREWFKPGRVVEIVRLDKKKILLKMELSLEKGSDYERISFTEI